MNTGLRLVFRKGDWLAILLVAALAVCTAAAYAVGGSAESGMVQVFQEGKLIREMALETAAEMIVEGDCSNTVTVAAGTVFFSDSDWGATACTAAGYPRRGAVWSACPTGWRSAWSVRPTWTLR